MKAVHTWVNIWSHTDTSMTGGDVSTDSNGHFELTGLDPDADDCNISIINNNQDNDLTNETSCSMETTTGVSCKLVFARYYHQIRRLRFGRPG